MTKVPLKIWTLSSEQRASGFLQLTGLLIDNRCKQQESKQDLVMKLMRSGLWIRLMVGSLATGLMSAPVSAEQSSVNVNVSGLRSSKGNIVLCLWKRQDKDFPVCSNTASFQHLTVKATDGTVTATFQNIPSGEYAISAFHDENQDGKLNRGFMGRPKEGIAFSSQDSNQGDRGRPSFDQAKFTVNGVKAISLSLLYF